MKIYNNTNITYSAIEQNGREHTKQNASAGLEKKMTQYIDTLSISKTGQESFRHLSSVCSMDYQNRFEKEVTDVFAKEEADGVKSDSFEHHVNRMAAAYHKMKNSIEEKYAIEDYEPEYYVTESGKIEELTKEKELDMLNQAYENHSNFMATSTEIWADLKDFQPKITYYSNTGQAATSETQTFQSGYKKNEIKNQAYQAFMSAISGENRNMLLQEQGNLNHLKLNLSISSSARTQINSIWDYYANQKH